jgi:CRP-like cAMP-binding protein
MNDDMLSTRAMRKAAQDYLFQQGETAADLYRIRTGIVCLESVNERGDRCITHLLGQGAVIGHEALLQHPRGFDARVCTDAVIETMAVPPTTDPARGAWLMQWAAAAVARLLQDAAAFRVELHRARAEEKVLLLLEQLRKLHAEKAEVCWLPSRYEMADILDIHHATASRVIARLFRDGALRPTARRDFAKVNWNRIRSLRSSH